MTNQILQNEVPKLNDEGANLKERNEKAKEEIKERTMAALEELKLQIDKEPNKNI